MSKQLFSKFALLLSVTAILVFNSCQKEINELSVTPNGNTDLTTRVNASVSGFVTDENNTAVSGATVKFGTTTVMTDEYGYFRFALTSVIKNAAMVSVTYPGYFKGIKTFIAEEGKSAFFRIALLPKTASGTFNATSGGVVSLPNGLSISFPSNAISDFTSSNSSPYSGTVHVSFHWLNPTANNLAQIMPGDLRGIDNNGALKLLQTYGMAAVELTGDAGQLLNITTGKTATITFPIPTSIVGRAPANIPLWSFDEALGLWKQEGNAVKTGTNYVGEVSHFSFWNCDVPNNYVQFNCTVVNANGAPIPYAWVKISLVSDPYYSRYGLTDSSGYVAGAIPDNAQLKLEVFTDFACGLPAYTQTFTTANANVSLGNITIPNNVINLATLAGTVTDCSNNPVSNGYLLMMKNGQYYRYGLSASGSFDFSTILCNGSENATFIAEDITAAQQSTPLNFTINSGANTLGNFQACGITAQQFFNYTINGANYAMSSPADTFYMYVNSQITPNRIEISGQNISSTSNRFITVGFDNSAIAVGSSQTMSLYYSSDINDSTSFNTPIMVNITEYGPVGAFISGNFSGNMTGTAPLNTPYVISGSFRVRRYQ